MSESQMKYGTCGMMSEGIPANSIELNIVKSRLSVSYMEVLCSYLELDCSEPKSGNDVAGWDVRIEPVKVNGDWETKPVLYVQLKSTVSPEVHNGNLSYSIDRRTYEELRKSAVNGKTLLAVLCLEDDTSHWVTSGDDCLMMRRVMYWCNIGIYPAIPDGQESMTLHIPLTNILCKESLHRMMDILSRGEVLGNEV